VLFLHGTPGSRLFCPDVTATIGAGVRLITFDRPGYGGSDPAPRPWRMGDLTADMIDLLDALSIDRAALVGWSGGGPHALAAVAKAAGRFRSATVVCAPAESTTARDESDEVMAVIERVRRDPDDSRELLRERCRWLTEDPHELLRLTERFDPEVLTASGMTEAFTAWMLEAGRHGVEGYVDDWLAEVCEWRFALDEITVPVYCWFGEADPLVGRHHAELLASEVAQCVSIGCPECRHFVQVAHWPGILAQLV
jgi:pimeloyl-ACP methyl ester carboxylesterase